MSATPERCMVWHEDFGACERAYGHEGLHARLPGGATEPNTWAEGTCRCGPCLETRLAGGAEARLAAVLALHRPQTEDAILMECLDGACDHDPRQECPEVEMQVCGECWRIRYEHSEEACFVPWPCATATAAGVVEGRPSDPAAPASGSVPTGNPDRPLLHVVSGAQEQAQRSEEVDTLLHHRFDPAERWSPNVSDEPLCRRCNQPENSAVHPGPPAHRPAPPDDLTPRTVFDLLSLVKAELPRGISITEVATWAQSDLRDVAGWAAATHLRASDNDGVQIPDLPVVLGACSCDAALPRDPLCLVHRERHP